MLPLFYNPIVIDEIKGREGKVGRRGEGKRRGGAHGVILSNFVHNFIQKKLYKKIFRNPNRVDPSLVVGD